MPDFKKTMTGKCLTLAVAESLTVGLLQARIGRISGASAFFRGGVTAYDIPRKVELLGVDQKHAESVCAVSQRVADEMACGACELFDTSLAAATTGFAEPDPSHGITVPYAFISVWSRNDGCVGKAVVRCPGMSRTDVQKHVAQKAFDELLKVANRWPMHGAPNS